MAPDLVEELLALAIRDGIGRDDHLWYAARANQVGTTLHRVPQTRMDKPEEAPSGFEPLYGALQAPA